jgi:hypothetical protein
MNCGFIFAFHKAVKYLQHNGGQTTGGYSVNENLMLKSRDQLEAKMATVFNCEIKQLSTELQRILIDDMVTAFQNRINVLKRSDTKAKNEC